MLAAWYVYHDCTSMFPYSLAFVILLSVRFFKLLQCVVLQFLPKVQFFAGIWHLMKATWCSYNSFGLCAYCDSGPCWYILLDLMSLGTQHRTGQHWRSYCWTTHHRASKHWRGSYWTTHHRANKHWWGSYWTTHHRNSQYWRCSF